MPREWFEYNCAISGPHEGRINPHTKNTGTCYHVEKGAFAVTIWLPENGSKGYYLYEPYFEKKLTTWNAAIRAAADFIKLQDHYYYDIPVNELVVHASDFYRCSKGVVLMNGDSPKTLYAPPKAWGKHWTFGFNRCKTDGDILEIAFTRIKYEQVKAMDEFLESIT